MRLRMKRGDASTFAMQVTSVDPVTRLAVPVDLTSAAIALAFTAKKRLSDLDADAVFTRTRAAGGIVVTDPVDGRIEVRLAAANTAGLTPPATLYWDLQLTASAAPVTLDSGLLFVEPDVTLA